MSACANLLDVNCWLALAYDGHSCHRAMKSIESELRQEGLVFCRLTQMGLLRLLTTSSAMGGTAMTMQEAWHCYDALLVEANVSYHDEPGGLEVPFRRFAALGTASPKVWSDAYLAAFAFTARLRLVTFDSALSRHPNVLVQVVDPGAGK